MEEDFRETRQTYRKVVSWTGLGKTLPPFRHRPSSALETLEFHAVIPSLARPWPGLRLLESLPGQDFRATLVVSGGFRRVPD